MPRLDFYSEYKLFVKIKLGEDRLLIGRGADCDVQLPDDRVSRHHARIELRADGGYWIEDLSANGTRVNFSMLGEPMRLGAGDRIYIERYVIMYQPDDVPSAILDDEKTRI